MQPTFLPWLGYFYMIDKADEFVFLDNVQFDKRSWQQRNKIKTPNGDDWITVPVLSKGMSKQLIQDVEISYEKNRSPLKKIFRTIEQNYNKSRYFKFYIDKLNLFNDRSISKLSCLNQKLIEWVCEEYSISTPLIRASELSADGSKETLLLNICKSRGASHFLSAPGSKNYLEGKTLFDIHGISVIYQCYSHPKYTQLYGDFIPYMCILDLLFNEGPKGYDILRSNNKLSLP